MRRLRPRWMLLRRISSWIRQRRWAASWLPSRQPSGAGGPHVAASCSDVSPGGGHHRQCTALPCYGCNKQPAALKVARLGWQSACKHMP